MSRMDKLDWDHECKKDFITNKGFRITDPGVLKKKKTPNGIFSQQFATDWEDDFSFSERYACNCKETKGKIFEGDTCPTCRSKVRFVDVDMDMTGWIIIDYGVIIQPTYYRKLESLMGKDVLPDIINHEKDITVYNTTTKKINHPYQRIGMLEFQKNYDEIIKYFYNKKKKEKLELYEELKEDRDKIFCHSIPVFSSVMRPVRIKNEEFFFATINKTYNVIFSLSHKINSASNNTKKKKGNTVNIQLLVQLARLQQKLMEAWTFIFEQIDSKEGHIKGEVLGGRINFTARNVIIPDPNLKADEVILCYRTFLELFQFEIVGYLVKIHDITENEAYSQWQWATINFNRKIYDLMEYIVKKQKPKVIINRPPTINYGSELCMKVVAVKMSSGDDYTMSLPLSILRVLNADFDGDNLTIISLKIKSLAKEYDRVFNPRKCMQISRNDGLFNDDFGLFKDQIIGLYEFNNI